MARYQQGQGQRAKDIAMCVDCRCQCLFAAVFGAAATHLQVHYAAQAAVERPTSFRLPYLSWALDIAVNPSRLQRSACIEAQPGTTSGVRKPTCTGSLERDNATCYSHGLEAVRCSCRAFVISSLVLMENTKHSSNHRFPSGQRAPL